MVSEDFPEPDTPVTTTSFFRGISTSTERKLCTRAPRIWIGLPSVDGVGVEFFFLEAMGRAKLHRSFTFENQHLNKLLGLAGRDG